MRSDEVLGDILPEVNVFDRKMGRENAGSDIYGAMKVAQDYCGVKSFPFFDGIWQHGCFGPWEDQTPHVHVYHAPNAQSREIFVARGDEVALLNRHGYRSVTAIGLPFCYVPAVRINKKNGALLVVPIHSLETSPFESEGEMENYAGFIERAAPNFSEVVICVHADCLKNNHWIKQFSARNYRCVVGARPNDANALLRMRTLFSHFEYVTTNGWGSHVAYALFCGAKVSICGDAPKRSVKSLEKDLGWGGNTAEMLAALSADTAARRDRMLARFLVSPTEGVCDVDFGEYLIGARNKLSPDQLKKRFGWNLADAAKTLFRNPRVYYNGLRNKSVRLLRFARGV